jgi:predicted dithiol-disulfide oxidoreductase (DUF899 family)
VRTHRQLVVYQSILQVLHESGCPLCSFLKEYQAARLQKRSESETHRRCNFHAWGLAAVQDAPAAAQAFIEPGTDRSGWGALGRVAEFLVSQRGLQGLREGKC